MDTPNTSPSALPQTANRSTFRTAGAVVRHVREVIEASVFGLNDLALRPDVRARERLTLQTLATIRLRAARALSETAISWDDKLEKSWTQYAIVFQIALTLRNEVSSANTVLEANEILCRVDQTLISALSAMREGNTSIAELCESIIDVVFQMERQGSIAINGEQDM
jgi:hypothetical protein